MEYEFILRIFCAAILGGLIGLEREYRAKEAGFRTHFLVALGSALFMIVSAYGFSDAMNNELLNLLEKDCRQTPQQLATLACGGGMYILSIASTLMVLIGLEAFNFILHKFDRHRKA